VASILFAMIGFFLQLTRICIAFDRTPRHRDLPGRWSSLDQQGAGFDFRRPSGFATPHSVEKITMLFRTNQETGPAIDLFRQASLASIGQ
jgi:hypothetical protein